MRQLIVMTLLTFILVAIFGMSLSMPTDKHGMMTNCPFMTGKSSICTMSATEHITKWQQLFTAASQSNNFFFLAALLAVVFIYIGFKGQSDLQTSSYAYRYYLYKRPEAKLFNYLTQAFSDGILHPKLYN